MFLEYYAGETGDNRESRFVAAFGGYGYSVPMAIVGSGCRHTQGPADYYNVFKSMIQADQARPAQARVEAWWRKVLPYTLRLYATVYNTSTVTLDSTSNEGGIWGLAWEDKATLGVTGMYTRKAVRSPLTPPLAPGASRSVVLDLPISGFADWAHLHSVVAAEVRPAGTTGPYDMLQAVRPAPAGFSALPASVSLKAPQGPGAAQVVLEGPRVLSWTASATVPWLAVSPETGDMGSSVRVEVRPEMLQAGQQLGTVTFTATSADGMSFSTNVSVTATYDPGWTRPPRLPRRRLSRAIPTETP